MLFYNIYYILFFAFFLNNLNALIIPFNYLNFIILKNLSLIVNNLINISLSKLKIKATIYFK